MPEHFSMKPCNFAWTPLVSGPQISMISSQSGSLSSVGRVRSSIKSKGADASIEAKAVWKSRIGLAGQLFEANVNRRTMKLKTISASATCTTSFRPLNSFKLPHVAFQTLVWSCMQHVRHWTFGFELWAFSGGALVNFTCCSLKIRLGSWCGLGDILPPLHNKSCQPCGAINWANWIVNRPKLLVNPLWKKSSLPAVYFRSQYFLSAEVSGLWKTQTKAWSSERWCERREPANMHKYIYIYMFVWYMQYHEHDVPKAWRNMA